MKKGAALDNAVVDIAKLQERQRYRLGDGKNGINQLLENPQLVEYIENQIKDPSIKKITKTKTFQLGDNKDFQLQNSIIFLKMDDGHRKAFMIGEELDSTSRNVHMKIAYDLSTGEGVALKVVRGLKALLEEEEINDSELDEEKQKDKQMKTELQREQKALSVFSRFKGFAQRLKGEQEKQYLAQDFVSGGNLDNYLSEMNDKLNATGKDRSKGKPLGQETIKELYTIAGLVCADILNMIHKNEMLHRDIKPANIMIDKTQDGFEINTIDFGGVIPANEADTIDDPSMGSQGYRAPELIEGGKPSYLTDTYSIGVMLKRMVDIIDTSSSTGAKIIARRDAECKSALNVLRQVAESFTSPQESRGSLEAGLEAILSNKPESFPEINIKQHVKVEHKL